MFRKNGDHYRSIDNARKAVRAGDTAEAERWLRIADRLLAIQERNDRLRKSRKPPETCTGPVLLDPNGCSPGGTPNSVLNQNRLARAKIGTRNPV
ncbi:MAG: hypothetical protein EON61_09540 [Alphaproteobacteria bacterium]|nr:MAG: hypothetical protein EON61_09540 [Alphaproteobacteria bacterium]